MPTCYVAAPARCAAASPSAVYPGHAWRACEPGAAEGGAAAAAPPAPAAPPALLFSAAAWTSWVLSGCDAADVGLADGADAAGGAPSELVDHDGGAGRLHRPRLLICWAVAASLLLVATLVLGCRELRADKRFCATFLILFLSVTQLVSTLLFLAILPSPPPADLLASSGDAADPAGPFAAAAAFFLLAVIVAAAWIATLVCRGDLLEARASLETSWTFELALLLATLGSAEVLHSLPWSRRGGGLALPIELLRLGPLWAIQAIYAYLVVAPAVGDPLTLNGALAALDRITIGAAPTPTVLALVCAAVTTLSLLTALFRGVLRCSRAAAAARASAAPGPRPRHGRHRGRSRGRPDACVAPRPGAAALVGRRVGGDDAGRRRRRALRGVRRVRRPFGRRGLDGAVARLVRGARGLGDAGASAARVVAAAAAPRRPHRRRAVAVRLRERRRAALGLSLAGGGAAAGEHGVDGGSGGGARPREPGGTTRRRSTPSARGATRTAPAPLRRRAAGDAGGAAARRPPRRLARRRRPRRSGPPPPPPPTAAVPSTSTSTAAAAGARRRCRSTRA